MKVEITIRQILREESNPERMVDRICNFMTFDREELLNAIKTYGTGTNDQRSAVLAVFWNPRTLRRKK